MKEKREEKGGLTPELVIMQLFLAAMVTICGGEELLMVTLMVKFVAVAGGEAGKLGDQVHDVGDWGHRTTTQEALNTVG
jgi:hypothetical protein